jgi:hypothetical protein
LGLEPNLFNPKSWFMIIAIIGLALFLRNCEALQQWTSSTTERPPSASGDAPSGPGGP